MLHLRVITPNDRTEKVCALLEANAGVTNMVVLSNAARRPRGDVVLCDVAREAANEALDALSGLGLEEDGSIALEQIDLSMSDVAKAAEAAAPGHQDDAVVWEELDERTTDSAGITWAYLAFLVLATLIAAIGVLVDSQILIVGAMVLGPEFGPVAAICFGAIRLDLPRIVRASGTLLTGFSVAIAVTFGTAVVGRQAGWIEPAMLDRNVMTDFIVAPDRWSFVIALLAGVAGVLSITAGKSSALVGVFISVTTVPAAGNIAVALALSHGDEVRTSLIQLTVNLAGMTAAGTLTLLVQKLAWRRFRPGPPGAAPGPAGSAGIRTRRT